MINFMLGLIVGANCGFLAAGLLAGLLEDSKEVNNYDD